MESDQQFFIENSGFSISNLVGGSYTHPGPLHGVEFQVSQISQKNFICDGVQKRSPIMFHSAIAPKLCYPALNSIPPSVHNNVDNGESIPSSFEEDSDDINALLGSEGYEECDEDEISTARTHANYESDSSDSFSSCVSKPKKSKRPPCQKTSGGGSNCKGERKHNKTRKLVNVLRGIVPGVGDQMNTAAVLDEAVRYLKSLKVEAQRLGVENLNN